MLHTNDMERSHHNPMHQTEHNLKKNAVCIYLLTLAHNVNKSSQGGWGVQFKSRRPATAASASSNTHGLIQCV